MVRACCVNNCSSGKSVPSHTFPTDVERRKKWILQLGIQANENEINKLRVCYTHFNEDDYSGSLTRRVLLYSALPVINIPQRAEHKEPCATQHEGQPKEMQDNEMQEEQNNEHHQELEASPLHKDSSVLSGHEQTEDLLHQHHMQLEQQNAMLMKQQQEINDIKAALQLKTTSSIVRPDLEEVTRKKSLSPRAKKLYEKVVQMKRQTRRLKRLMDASKSKHKTHSIQLHTTKRKGKHDNTTYIRQQFINMVVRNNNVAPQGRRYTLEEKMFCVGICRGSRSTYTFISKYLLCPSAKSLDKQLQSIPFDTGCNNIMLRYLKLAAKEIDPNDLHIVLIWDEMSLQPATSYDKNKDKIIGFEDWGMRRTRKFADHAILFYIRCLSSGNRLPLGYGFCNAMTRTIQLVQCIKQWITALIHCGFTPLATVCDQGGPNVAAVNMFITESNAMRLRQHKHPKNTFLIGNQEIIPLYDYVHLQKGLRNNLLTKDLLINKYMKTKPNQVASWKDIVIAYNMDKYSFLKQRQMPKLVDRHIFADMIPKMKVKYATQAMSHTVANFFDLVFTWNNGYVNTKKGEMRLAPSAATTAEVILFFDNLFDSFNGKEGKTYSSIISSSSNHIEFWQNAVETLRKMEYVECTTHKHIRHNTKCLQNFVWTIQGAQQLWYTLKNSGLSSFNLRFINQDPVENCFSQIRDHGHRNNNPTPNQFCGAFKTLITTNVTSKHSIGSNCKEDYEGTSLSLAKMLSVAENSSCTEEDNVTECAETFIQPTTCHGFLDTNKIITMLTSNMKCATCIQCLQHEDTLITLENALQIAETQFTHLCYELKVKQKLKSVLYLEAFSKISLHCVTEEDDVIDKTAQYFIVQWCNHINKLLNGMIQNEDDNFLYNAARKMSTRFKKEKLKIKKTSN